ncbi:MAG: hypothetical protein KDD73_06605 [Anaerolineales bacterium]|nr:hypothetical protein [Anaerolineales bacterium]MCB9126866.1 stress response translation initiation inhibitor YciH [Ardenticatenales bacterium]MCB9172846.1 stress response translation initiation inhibitor YciH [Ardenticatenales bacterium]
MAKTVYSTDPDWQPQQSGRRVSRDLPPKEQTIYAERDRKGRRGKTVTVLSGFVHKDDTMQKLLKQLKSTCGAGGTLKDGGTLEIQGDHRDRLAELLRERGYKVKLKGG